MAKKPTKKPMPRATLAALKKSIAHWRRLAIGARQLGERIGSSDCALCEEFNHHSNATHATACQGCPVFAKTGKKFCKGTPYIKANDTLYRLMDQADISTASDAYNHPDFKSAALDEFLFLRDLLPKEKV